MDIRYHEGGNEPTGIIPIRQTVTIILRIRPELLLGMQASGWMEICYLPIGWQIRGMGDVECEVGMRYGNPSIGSALEGLKSKGVCPVTCPHYR